MPRTSPDRRVLDGPSPGKRRNEGHWFV